VKLEKGVHYDVIRLGKDRTPDPNGWSAKILKEEWFVELCINRMVGCDNCKEYGLHSSDISANRKYWNKYAAEIARVKSIKYSLASKAKRHDYKYKEVPGVLLEEQEFRKFAEIGMPVETMAKHFGTSVWYVFKNIEYYKIPYDGNPYSMSNLAKIECLAKVNPGIIEAAKKASEDPFTFYAEVHKTFLQCWEYLDMIAEFKQKFNLMCEKGKLDRKHICFNNNKGERILSRLLLHNQIPFRTQFPLDYVGGTFWYDFALEGTNVLIEVDGDYHRIDEKTKARDIVKTREATAAGYELYRIDRYELEKSEHKVLEELKKWLTKHLK